MLDGFSRQFPTVITLQDAESRTSPTLIILAWPGNPKKSAYPGPKVYEYNILAFPFNRATGHGRSHGLLSRLPGFRSPNLPIQSRRGGGRGGV